MAGVTCLTVLGFALMAFTTGTASRLIGYCEWHHLLPGIRLIVIDLTGSSNAVFVLALSLVSGNVGGTTKKVLTTACKFQKPLYVQVRTYISAIFLGVAAGNIVGPYSFISSEAPIYRTGTIVCMASRAAEVVVILMLRACFVIPNKKRNKLFSEGDERYDPDVQVSHFMYR